MIFTKEDKEIEKYSKIKSESFLKEKEKGKKKELISNKQLTVSTPREVLSGYSIFSKEIKLSI